MIIIFAAKNQTETVALACSRRGDELCALPMPMRRVLDMWARQQQGRGRQRRQRCGISVSVLTETCYFDGVFVSNLETNGREEEGGSCQMWREMGAERVQREGIGEVKLGIAFGGKG